MARKQVKKRTFGHAAAGTDAHTATVSSPSATTTATRPSTAVDNSRYTYVKQDLKQIAIILVVILALYGGIFLANQSLHLF